MQGKENLSFLITFLGCKVNSYEVECVANDLEKNGYHLFDSDLDIEPTVVVINTCAVTKTSEDKDKKIIKRYRHDYPNSILCVMGCYSQFASEKVASLGANVIVGTKNRSAILKLINNYKTTKTTQIEIIDDKKATEIYEDLNLSHYLFNTRAFVKIQDGCNNFCSYCLIPFVRGRSRSRKKEDVLKEINTLVKNNYKEIVLTGIDTASYGLDLYDDYGFSDLLEDILKQNSDLYRLRISSIEESQIDEKFIKLLKDYPNIADHLHIPLQSGSESVLKSMRRKYDLKSFKNKIAMIREVRPKISITTDVIVGFPGESDLNFLETYRFIEDIKFSKVHVFPYSKRSGTLASTFNNEIGVDLKKERVARLLKLSDKLEYEYCKQFNGTHIEFLFESAKKGHFIGHSSNFLETSVISLDDLNGKTLKVQYVYKK